MRRANSQQLLSADIAARIAHEDRVQAKAALLPSASWENGFVYTQPNGTRHRRLRRQQRTTRLYQSWRNVHGDVLLPANAPITGWPSPPKPSRAPEWKSRRAA